MTDADNDKTLAVDAHLDEGFAERLEKDLPIKNQGRRGFGQVRRRRGQRGAIRQQQQQRLKVSCFSGVEEFRNDTLVLFLIWWSRRFPGGKPFPSAPQDLAAILFTAVHHR